MKRKKEKKAFFIALVWLLSVSLPAIDIPKAGVGFRFSAFGIPNPLLDNFVYEHPTISGHSFCAELRVYGRKGPRSAVSYLFALEYSKLSGSGFWRENEDSRQLDVEGEISQVNLTATVIFAVFPSFVVHPYLGLGLGVGKASIWSEGVYTDEDPAAAVKDIYLKDLVVPVVHLPIGIMINISDKVEVRIEGGFKNGLYLGGAVVYNF